MKEDRMGDYKAEQSNGLVRPKIEEQGRIPLKNKYARNPQEKRTTVKTRLSWMCLSGETKSENCLRVSE